MGGNDMSIILSCIYSNKFTMIGDTQLNNPNGAIEMTTLKVFPLNNNTTIGLTGDYKNCVEILKILDKNPNVRIMSFNRQVIFFRNKLKAMDGSINIILASNENGCRYIIIGTDLGFENAVEHVNEGFVIKALLPPDISPDMCSEYFKPNDMETSLFTCIEELSKKSKYINDKICGFRVSSDKLETLCKNIKYEEINLRI